MNLDPHLCLLKAVQLRLLSYQIHMYRMHLILEMVSVRRFGHSNPGPKVGTDLVGKYCKSGEQGANFVKLVKHRNLLSLE